MNPVRPLRSIGAIKKGLTGVKLRHSYMIFLSILVCALIVVAVFVKALAKQEKKLKCQRNEMISLRDEYGVINARLFPIESRRNTKIESLSSTIEDMATSLGIKPKVKAIKTLEKRSWLGLNREDAEVSFAGLNMNELVNLLYTIENEAYPLAIRKAHLETSFESPDSLNTALVISAFSQE